jgi:Membrane dipeptidase (Peptidase family M19)
MRLQIPEGPLLIGEVPERERPTAPPCLFPEHFRGISSALAHTFQFPFGEHVGLGGDFDGTDDVTADLEDVSTYPVLFAELLRRGWTEPDCAALAGGNLLRALRSAEAFASAAM